MLVEMTSDRVSRYLDHLDALMGGVEPRFVPVESTHPDLERLFAIIYIDTPEPGYTTGFTYGLSRGEDRRWLLGKPELCISVRSRDERWPLAVASIAEQLRGECGFCYGDTIDFGEPMSAESSMSSLVVFAPAGLERADFLGIQVDDGLPINIAGCYPIHDSERHFIRAHGLERFWAHDLDPFDVTRVAIC